MFDCKLLWESFKAAARTSTVPGCPEHTENGFRPESSLVLSCVSLCSLCQVWAFAGCFSSPGALCLERLQANCTVQLSNRSVSTICACNVLQSPWRSEGAPADVYW